MKHSMTHHPHLPVLSIRRRSEVSVVGSRSILSVGDDGVVSLSTSTVVGLLEVSSEFVESESVGEVVELFGCATSTRREERKREERKEEKEGRGRRVSSRAKRNENDDKG